MNDYRDGLRFTTDRTPMTHHNPDPVSVRHRRIRLLRRTRPVGGPGHPLPSDSVVVYLPIVGGEVHLKLRYFAPCRVRICWRH